MKMKHFAALAAAVGAMSVAVVAHAGTPALDFDQNNGLTLGNGPFTLGWEFTTSAKLKLDGLGVFDDSLDGLNESHDVGLWDNFGNLLASTTVGSGTSGTLIDNFRYNSISPLTIGAGTYFIGALWLDGGDNNVFVGQSGTVTTIPQVSYVSASYVAGGSLANPTNTGVGAPGYFGPNFTAGGVPEPTSWALMLVGFGGLGVAMRSRRKLAYATA